MAKMFTTPKRLLALLCASALLAAMPLSVTMDARTGVVALGSAVALADNDGGHDGNDHGTGGNGFDDNGYYQGGTGFGNGSIRGNCRGTGRTGGARNCAPAPTPAPATF